jgi:hypothetical protein
MLYGLIVASRVGSNLTNTIKPAHVFTSIKQSPVLKGHILYSKGDLLIQVRLY